MSTNKAMMIVALLAASCVCVQAAEFYTPPVVSVALLDKAPEVDGTVGSQEWGQVAMLSDFITLGGQASATPPTVVYLGYTNEALYVGATLFDPNPQQLRREVTQRDGEVWRDDCLELFVDTTGDRQNYAHLAVNALGTKYDSYDRVVTEDFQWDASSSGCPSPIRWHRAPGTSGFWRWVATPRGPTCSVAGDTITRASTNRKTSER